MDARGRRASAQPRPRSKKEQSRRRPGSSSSVSSGRSSGASLSAAATAAAAASSGASRPSASPPPARLTRSELDFRHVRARIELEARQALGSSAGPLALGEYLLLRSFCRDRVRCSSCSSETEAAEPPRRRLDPDEVWRQAQAEEEEKRAKEARRLMKKELWKPRGARIEKKQKQ